MGAVLALLTAGAVEVSVRAAFSVGPVFEKLYGFDESSERLRWVRLRRGGESFTYGFDVYDPILGWGVQPGLRELRVFGDKRLSTNSVGLRGAAEHAPVKAEGVTRIVLLGDSYTFGDEVSDDETWAHHLERLLPGTEVLNMGVHGFGHDQALLYLGRDGVGYRPDLVVLGFVWFDIHRNLFAFTNYAKPTYRLEDGGLKLENVPVPSPERTLAREPWRPKAVDLARMAWERVRWATGANDRRAEALSAAILDEMARVVRAAGAVPVYVYLPVLAETLDTTSAPTPNEEFLLGYCGERDVACMFFRQDYARRALVLGLRDITTHWSPPGHRIVAEEVAKRLVESGLVPAPPSPPGPASGGLTAAPPPPKGVARP